MARLCPGRAASKLPEPFERLISKSNRKVEPATIVTSTSGEKGREGENKKPEFQANRARDLSTQIELNEILSMHNQVIVIDGCNNLTQDGAAGAFS